MTENTPIPARRPIDTDRPTDSRYSRREVPAEDFNRLIEESDEG